MDAEEIFDKFGVDAGKALVIDKIYVPKYMRLYELVELSKRRKKTLHLVKRHKVVYVVNGYGATSKEYSLLNRKTRRLIEDALEKADTKNAGYNGM
jgi:hypothetical protein